MTRDGCLRDLRRILKVRPEINRESNIYYYFFQFRECRSFCNNSIVIYDNSWGIALSAKVSRYLGQRKFYQDLNAKRYQDLVKVIRYWKTKYTVVGVTR